VPPNFSVFPFSPHYISELLEKSNQASYLIQYLQNLEAKTYILEEEYVDKDYMIDFQKFYARSFEKIGKFTKRIHFFNEKFDEKDFQKALESNDKEVINTLKRSYLGFTVVKPLRGADGNKLIGRTLLKTYPEEVDDEMRIFIKKKYTASLFGIPLEIESLPFQAQDQGVSACATIALWSALHPLSDIFEIKRDSPAEITEIATSLPFSRKFPSSGLTFEQMINYIQSLGLDTEVIRQIDEKIISTAIKAYINADFPLIADLKLKKNGEDYELHAAIISGYRCDKKGNIKELYVHDDQIGPYSRVKPLNNGFKYWDNEWKDYGYNSIEVEKLLIPIYSKIRMTFSRIYRFVEMEKGVLDTSNLYLYSVRKYKEFLLGKSVMDKLEKLTMSLPRFLWVLRLFEDSSIDSPLLDIVFDGTSVFPKEVTRIYFL